MTSATDPPSTTRSPAQVILRWHIEHGLCVISKSVKTYRIAENIDIFDLAMTQEEVVAIDALDTGRAQRPHPNDVGGTAFHDTPAAGGRFAIRR
jgi:diketogulonate reductase-like aldo/keto reductase